jgi:hypothetical protein
LFLLARLLVDADDPFLLRLKLLEILLLGSNAAALLHHFCNVLIVRLSDLLAEALNLLFRRPLSLLESFIALLESLVPRDDILCAFEFVGVVFDNLLEELIKHRQFIVFF